jgi:ornithine cyclodeaminase/alanine dehydrogenase-like protein (mu-crystallin family)
MATAFVDADMLRAKVTFADLIDSAGEAFRRYSAGQASSELIVMVPGADKAAGDVYVKTGTITGHPSYVVKVSPWFAVNAAAGRSQGGFIAVFDAETGHTRAIIDDQHLLSDLRTGAAGALVARHFAPLTVRSVLVVGTGTQALLQPQALHHERPFRRLAIWGRDATRALALSGRLSEALPGVEISVTANLAEAVGAADVILGTTASTTPIIRGEWLRPGQHITSIGSDDATKSELDADVLRRAGRAIVDGADTARANGNVHRHLAEGAIPADFPLHELGAVLAGAAPGRTGDDEITVATLSGLGVQDLAAAHASLGLLGLG